MRMFATVLLVLSLTDAGFAAVPPKVPAAVMAGQAADTKTMLFRFEDTAVEDIVREVAIKFGIAIEKQGLVPGRVSIMVPEPLNEEQAVSLLGTILLAVHYAAVERHYEGDPRRILRVMPFEQAKKEVPIQVQQ